MTKKQQTQLSLYLFFYGIATLFALLFSAQAHALTISGTCKQADNITDCTDTGTIRFATNANGGTLFPESQPIVAGTWSITGIPAQSTGVIITVFIDGAADHQEAVAVLNYDGVGDITGVELIETHLSIGSDDTRGISNLDLSRYDNSVSGDEDIFYDVDASLHLTVDATGAVPNETLYIKSGYSYAPGGDISTHHVEINGIFGMGNNTINVSGDWEMTNGTFNRDSSTVNFTGTGTISNDLAIWWGKPFYKINMAASGQTTTILVGRGIAVANIATLGSGTLAGGRLMLNNATTPLIHAGTTFLHQSTKFSRNATIPAGNYTSIWLASGGASATFTLSDDITCSTLSIRGNAIGNLSILDTAGHNVTCNNLDIGHSSSDRNGQIILNNSILTINESLIINGDTLGINEIQAGSGTVKVGKNWSNQGTFTASTSNVIFNGSNNQLITTGGDAFYNLTLENTGASNSNIATLQDPLIINNDLLVIQGKLDTSTSNHSITIVNNLNQTATGEIEARASTITVTGDVSLDGTLDRSNYNSASFILNGTGSLIYDNLGQWWENGFNNLTVGQPGQTTTGSTTFALFNQLTIGSGHFAGTSSIYLRSIAPLNLDPSATISINNLVFLGSNLAIPSLNNGYDCDIKLSIATVTQTGDITLNTGNNLFINADTFSNRISTYNTNGFNLTIGGNLILGAGGDTALKTLDISNSNVTVAGNFEIRTGTNDLIATNSNVTLNGTGAQAVTMNGKGFERLTVSNASATGVTFNDGFTTNELTNTTPNGTMTFAAGQNYTINNAVTLQGASGQLLNLLSSVPGTHWNFILNSAVSKSISHVNVSWSDASGSDASQKPINPSNTLKDTDSIDWFPAPLNVTKSTLLISDPIHGTSAGKGRIPGAVVEYRIVVQNAENYAPDANTVVIYDVLDANVEYDVTTGVVFSDGANSSGLTLGTIQYSHTSTPTVYNYSPTGSFDPNVAGIKVETNGSFAFGGSPPPEFTIRYRVRVK